MSWSPRAHPPTVVVVKADQRDRLGDLLDHMEAEAGPIPPELLDEARRLWQLPRRSESGEGVDVRDEDA